MSDSTELRTYYIVTTEGEGLATARSLEEAAAPFKAPVHIYVIGREATPEDLRAARPFRSIPSSSTPAAQ